jgi:DNA-directed RNA polymerase specialized sigma24 family protein
VLGAAVGTVKSRTSRALARLAAELEQAPGTERTGRPR